MHALQRSLLKTIMMTSDEYLSSGLPKPVTEMTLEQDLEMRKFYDAISQDEVAKDDLLTVIMALKHQNFILSNSMMNLVKKWPTISTSKTAPNTEAMKKDQPTTKEVKPRFGTLFGITI